MEREAGLIVFDSTNIALKAERALKDAGIPCAVIPTPREITAECGIALLVRHEWVEKASGALEATDGVAYKLIDRYGQGRTSGKSQEVNQ